VHKQHFFRSTTIDKWITSYKPLDQRVKKNREEESKSEEDSISGVTTPASLNFKDVWSFNHPHLNVKEHWEKLHWMEVLVEKGTFWVFQEEEHDDYNYTLESSLLWVWEYTKANKKRGLFFTIPRSKNN
jgi:hypothetical protein